MTLGVFVCVCACEFLCVQTCICAGKGGVCMREREAERGKGVLFGLLRIS